MPHLPSLTISLLESMPDIIFIKDAQGVYCECNTAFARHIGRRKEDILGKKDYDLYPQKQADLCRENDRLVIELEKPRHETHGTPSPDGREIVLDKLHIPWRDADGTIIGIIGMYRDITERKQVEQEMEASRVLLQNVLDAIPVRVFWKDSNLRFLGCNRSFANDAGKDSPAELIGKTDHEMEGNDPSARDQNDDRTVIASGIPHLNLETAQTTPDGREIILRTSKIPLRDVQGRIMGILGMYEDITNIKQTEKTLKEEIVRRRILVEQSRDGIVVLDQDGSVYEANKRFAEMLGYAHEEVLQLYLWDWDTQWTRDQLLTMLQQVDAKGDHFVTRHQRKDGTFCDVEISTNGTVISGQKLVFCVCRDITERKRAEQALRESEARFHNLLAQVPNVAVQGYGMDGITQYWNQASERLYGYSAKEALGKNLLDLIIPDDMRAEVLKSIQTMAETHVPIPATELNLKRKDGSRVPVYSSHAIVQRPGSSPELFCIDVDLTELKETEKALRQAKMQAEKANQTKSAFLANMSHEIRTPINGIMGMMQLLETTSLDAEQQQYVELATGAATRLTGLLTDILDLSRVEAGKMELVHSEFSLDELGNSIISLFSMTALKKKMDLHCTIDPDMPPTLIGDETRLRQVLFNLVGNALKYSDKGRIDVQMVPLALQRGGGIRVLFSIKDTGIGIPENRLREIFEPFRQVESSYSKQMQGVGLGLAIVKRLVDLMEGHITIDSQPGEGTAVHVVLPFKLPVDAPQAETTAAPQAASKGLRILLAEDEPLSGLFAKTYLEKVGHHVALAENGRQALDLLASQDYDVILMDVQMPVMNGVEATREIRRLEDEKMRRCENENGFRVPGPRPSRIPIIALTAYAMTGDRDKFLEAGMNDYLAKPVRVEDLEKMLQKVAENETIPRSMHGVDG